MASSFSRTAVAGADHPRPRTAHPRLALAAGDYDEAQFAFSSAASICPDGADILLGMKLCEERNPQGLGSAQLALERA
eukprot:scaffold7362_cov266-Pinguiococcus_pyrenoidosus.AAC.18